MRYYILYMIRILSEGIIRILMHLGDLGNDHILYHVESLAFVWFVFFFRICDLWDSSPCCNHHVGAYVWCHFFQASKESQILSLEFFQDGSIRWDESVKNPISVVFSNHFIPSKIEWDLTNGPLSKLLGLLDAWGSVPWVLLEIS